MLAPAQVQSVLTSRTQSQVPPGAIARHTGVVRYFLISSPDKLVVSPETWFEICFVRPTRRALPPPCPKLN